MDTEATPQGNKVTALLNKVYEAEITQAKSRSEQNSSTANYAILFSCIAFVIGTLLAVTFGIFLSLSIVKPINRVVTGLGNKVPTRLQPPPPRCHLRVSTLLKELLSRPYLEETSSVHGRRCHP